MEAYLNQIVDYMLTQSWQIAVLTTAIATAAFALKNRSAHIRYLLWLIVLAKCLMPPLLTIPLAILPQQAPTEPIVVSSPVEIVALDHEVTDTAALQPLERPSVSVEATSAPIVTDRAKRKTVREWVAIAWMVGAGVYLVMNLLRALRANLWLARQRRPLSAKLQTDIENLLSAYGFKSLPKIWLMDDISQPFVWGLLRGSIYLPTNFTGVRNPERQRSILGHELSHILRFDAAVNILQVIAQALFWFHPFVWWANRKIRQEREKCCDEMAIARLNTLPKDYSTAILDILASKHKSTRPVPSLAVAGPVKNIEERIRTMLRPGKKFYKHPSLVTVTVVLLLALLTVPTALVLTSQAGTKAGVPPLYKAASDGDIEQVKLLVSKGAGDKAAGSKARKDRIAVTVNGVDITETQIKRLVSPELERRLEAWLDSSPESIEQERRRLRQKILQELIEAQLLAEKVKEGETVIGDQDMEKALRASASEKGMSVAQWWAEVEASGREFDKVKQKIREELTCQKMIEEKVTEHDARNYYEKHIKKYTDVRVRASLILIRPKLQEASYNWDKAWELALDQAHGLVKQLKAGADFGELAQTYSQEDGTDPNGDLGFVPGGQLVPPIDRALLELEVGQISGLVKTAFGICILKATDRKEKARPFDDVRNDVMRQAYLDRLRAEADIVYPPSPSPQPDNKPAAEIDPWAIFDHEQVVDWTAVRNETIGGMHWRVLPTEKFQVYFRKGSEPLVKDCVVQLDNVFRFMEYYFPDHGIKNKIRVIASADLGTHRKMQSVLHADGSYDAPRMDTRGRVPQIFISAASWCIPIIMHETTHVFYYRSGYTGANKNWDFVGEWLCGYFQEKYSDRPKYKFDEDTLAKRAMRRYLKEHPEFSLEDLKQGKEGVSDPDAFEQIVACFYSFLEERYASPRFHRFLSLLLEEEDLDTAAKRVYSKTLTELNVEWRDYFGLPSS